MHIPWDHKYDTNIKIIDQQHRYFLEMINELADSIRQGKGADDYYRITDELKEYVHGHLAFEEKYFKEFDYPDTAAHIEAHNDFRLKILEMEQMAKGKEPMEALEILDYLETWFLAHIRVVDQKYVECFKDNGLQ